MKGCILVLHSFVSLSYCATSDNVNIIMLLITHAMFGMIFVIDGVSNVPSYTILGCILIEAN